MDGPIIGYVRIFEWPFEPWWQFRPNLTQKMFFGLIFQEFRDFSGAIWKSRHWHLSIGIGIDIGIRI